MDASYKRRRYTFSIFADDNTRGSTQKFLQLIEILRTSHTRTSFSHFLIQPTTARRVQFLPSQVAASICIRAFSQPDSSLSSRKLHRLKVFFFKDID